jgi:hypothetical protein
MILYVALASRMMEMIMLFSLSFFLSWTIVLVYGAFITMILFMTRNHRMVKITLPVTIFGVVFVCIHVYLNTTPLNDSTYRVAVNE